MQTGKLHFNVNTFAIIILAAGRSSRLGSPKQLLSYRGKTLLQHSIDSAKQTGSNKVIVVLGSGKDLIGNKIDTAGIEIAENPDWESGISSSIKAGINALKKIAPDVDALILMVCDQPFADAEILKALIKKQTESGKAIVGCMYENTKGTPALFHSSLFPDLLALKGDTGAKKLFKKYKDAASFVSFKNGGIDIDTSEDYQNLPK
ncbi:nucleotidyltransferase family protein [Daejeonella sp.]|uniref:nucleotidyltransferase family protein n=1 Tax=Daejeonella sp. TaxID=2805397 RepID=UPI0030BA8AA2